MKRMNAFYSTREDSRPDFNQLSAFIGRTIPGTQTELEYLFVAPDDPDLARLAYEALSGFQPMYPDLPEDRFVIWAKLGTDLSKKRGFCRLVYRSAY